MMGIGFSITDDKAIFRQYNGARINYSKQIITDNEIQIINHTLLFESAIQEQTIDCFEVNGYKAFFRTAEFDSKPIGFLFDIFAASFYLATRYEEYLPHTKDMYGRYAHENSLAFKEQFLSVPLINIWADDLRKLLQKKYSIVNSQYSGFKFVPTYDIDIAYAYKHKGFFRNFAGAIRSLFSFDIDGLGERINTLLANKKDPFDTYDKLDALHRQYELHPIYFFLVAEKNAMYDKNILPHKKAIQHLIQAHSKKYSIGIHPSWQSGDDVSLLKKEKEYLETIGKKTITNSRQHYIRFTLPGGYRQLINAGIQDDYSMGYGSINGFRASVANSFYWYDLQKEMQTDLRIHPFCYMEANSYYEQKLTASEAFDELMQYYTICKKVNGTFITIWHNHMIGGNKLFKDWADMYKKFLQKIC